MLEPLKVLRTSWLALGLVDALIWAVLMPASLSCTSAVEEPVPAPYPSLPAFPSAIPLCC